MPNTTNLVLPLMAAAQAQKHLTHNDALLSLDAIVQLSVLNSNLSAPPGSPVEGQRHIIGSGATGAWAGKDLNVTYRSSGAWVFLVPRKGWIAYDEANNSLLTWTGSAWVNFATAASLASTANIAQTFLGPLTFSNNISALRLGIGGATADATNRLSLNTPAALFNNAGTSVNLVLNKNAVANDASVTFQTSFSARALVGLLASDDFIFKVTPNGSNYFSGIRTFRNLHGRVAVKQTMRQTSAEWRAVPNSININSYGLNYLPTGTFTAAAPSASNLFTQSSRTRIAPAAAVGSAAALNGTALCYWRGNAADQGGFYLRIVAGIEVFQATSRMFLGLAASTAVLGNVNPSTLLNIVGIGFDSGDTQMQLLTNDGTGTATKTALGAGFPTTGGQDLYELILSAEPNGSEVRYRVERLNGGNVVEGAITTDLPLNTSFMTPHIWYNNGTSAGSCELAVLHMYAENASLLGSRGLIDT